MAMHFFGTTLVAAIKCIYKLAVPAATNNDIIDALQYRFDNGDTLRSYVEQELLEGIDGTLSKDHDEVVKQFHEETAGRGEFQRDLKTLREEIRAAATRAAAGPLPNAGKGNGGKGARASHMGTALAKAKAGAAPPTKSLCVSRHRRHRRHREHQCSLACRVLGQEICSRLPGAGRA